MIWKKFSYIKKGTIIGIIISLLVWLYDVDFLLNFGGPSPTIVTRVPGGLFGMITIGGVIGALIGLFFKKIKSK